MRKLNSKKKKGFTLIELIIVVAILGILAMVAIPKFSDAQKNAKISADIANAKSIATATSALVVNGTISKTSGTIADADKKKLYAEGTYYTISSSGTDIGKVIADELQSVPKPQATSSDTFFVTISDENVTVYVTKGTAAEGTTKATSGTQVYPNPADGTYHK